MAIDSTKIQKVKTALDNRYENKQSNKKTSITGSFTGDTESYPTAQAVKDYVEGQGYLTTHQDITGKEDTSNKVKSTVGWSATTSDDRYPSEKLVKNSLDNKISTSSTVGLVKNDGSIDTNTYLTTGTAYSTYAQKNELFSGSYDDLTDKPSIPTKTSDLTNDGDGVHVFLTEHQSLANYVTTSDSRLTDARTPTSHTHGSISTDGKLGSESGKIITTGTGGVLQASSSITTSMISDFPTDITPSSHTQASSTITDTNTYSNIANSNTTQESINSAIDSKLGALASVEYYEITTANANTGEPSTTASSSTMNKLYLIKSSNDKEDNYDTFITVHNGNSYNWEKIDSTSLDLSGYVQSSSLKSVATSGSYSDLTNKPSFTPTVTSSTNGAYKIGSINISGSSVDIYGKDTGTQVDANDIDEEINQALDELAEAIYPTAQNNG